MTLLHRELSEMGMQIIDGQMFIAESEQEIEAIDTDQIDDADMDIDLDYIADEENKLNHEEFDLFESDLK